MSEHIIKCYRNNKLILNVKCFIRRDVFIKQLESGVIYYDTDICKGGFEIINLKQFDRIVIENENYYNEFVGDKI